jgi:hypothetical protein
MLGVNLQKSHQEVAVWDLVLQKTLIARAKREVPGFVERFAKFEERVVIGMPLAY